MSRDDAPNFRLVKTENCFACNNCISAKDGYRCMKHNIFLGIIPKNHVCDDWEGL
jgi:hypothetical protein